MNLTDAFKHLPQSTTENSFQAIQLNSRRNDFLAKATDGSPVFLLFDSSAPSYYPAFNSKHVTMQFHVTCEVRVNESSLRGQFAVVSCNAKAFELHPVFVKCLAAVVDQLPDAATTKDLHEAIHSILDLFKSIRSSQGREITGLWAELYLILCSNDVSSAVTAWHSGIYERFDFSWRNGCIEVKATTQSLRTHRFSLEQLLPPFEGSGRVASFLLQPITGGLGVLELAEQIDLQIQGSATLRQKLWTNITLALGADFSSKLDKHFDVTHAKRNFMLYNMTDIPTVPLPTDPRVSSVEFRVDLTAVPSSLSHSSIEDLFE